MTTELKKKPLGLSDDAWYFGRAMLSMMTGDGTLTFRMKETQPTDRTQKALDELVINRLVSVESFNDLGGKVYRPLVKFPTKRITAREHASIGHWPIAEKIK